MNPDKRVFELMENLGGDTHTIRPVNFYFYFDDKNGANIFSERLKSMHFQIVVSQSSYDHKWLCLATRSMQPDSDLIEGLRPLFNNMCAKLNGDYDGWETELIL